MRFAKCKTFEEGFALSRRERTSIYIAIEEKVGCEYKFHPDGACDRISEYCPVCSKNGGVPNRIQKENHRCPNCYRDYSPQLASRMVVALSDGAASHVHAS